MNMMEPINRALDIEEERREVDVGVAIGAVDVMEGVPELGEGIEVSRPSPAAGCSMDSVETGVSASALIILETDEQPEAVVGSSMMLLEREEAVPVVEGSTVLAGGTAMVGSINKPDAEIFKVPRVPRAIQEGSANSSTEPGYVSTCHLRIRRGGSICTDTVVDLSGDDDFEMSPAAGSTPKAHQSSKAHQFLKKKVTQASQALEDKKRRASSSPRTGVGAGKGREMVRRKRNDAVRSPRGASREGPLLTPLEEVVQTPKMRMRTERGLDPSLDTVEGERNMCPGTSVRLTPLAIAPNSSGEEGGLRMVRALPAVARRAATTPRKKKQHMAL